ncbi:GLPGLI family protein [Psychroflexus sp. CAK8W]|uniref:GLPGLI family protein n=1 Tax=Psychroflexus longus TaxID=2873596 RepID=A0ABS7XMA4_9FLAO|nr:GLPGLI family protein [Psychroflexus longus]MBZ9779524.1 GLPGLI family protein [Psychroflexus longus]
MFFSFGQNNYESQYDYINVGLGKTIPVKHIFNSNESISIFNFQGENNLTQDESGELSFKISLNDSIGNQYYNRSDKLIFRDVVFNSGKEYVIVEDDLPDFKWQISKETKQIGPYQCLKATGSFRGRTYKVLFTPEIINQFGPWKFKGLPGIILEIYTVDEPMIHHWRATQVKYPFDTELRLDYQNDLEIVDYKEIVEERRNILNCKCRECNLESHKVLHL